jgi:cytosine deaminase
MPNNKATESDESFLGVAIEEARAGLSEGGVPIGAALVIDGTLISKGRNRRVQWNSAIRHGEMDCIESAGRLPANAYARATIYTTLSPCHMCTGAILLYGIPRVVLGENRTFMGMERELRENGVDVINMDSSACVRLMTEFIDSYPEIWNEDIGR